MRNLVALAVAGLLVAAAGCSVRYSRTLDNASLGGARRVMASSTGLEIIGIEVDDTDTAANLLKQVSARCNSVKNVEVDYRATVILIVSIPKLTVSADCE